MTSKDKKQLKKFMRDTMEDKKAKFSIYPLWKGESLQWPVFRQLVYKFLGLKGDDKPTVEQKKCMQDWGEWYNNKRQKALRNKLD